MDSINTKRIRDAVKETRDFVEKGKRKLCELETFASIAEIREGKFKKYKNSRELFSSIR